MRKTAVDLQSMPDATLEWFARSYFCTSKKEKAEILQKFPEQPSMHLYNEGRYDEEILNERDEVFLLQLLYCRLPDVFKDMCSLYIGEKRLIACLLVALLLQNGEGEEDMDRLESHLPEMLPVLGSTTYYHMEPGSGSGYGGWGYCSLLFECSQAVRNWWNTYYQYLPDGDIEQQYEWRSSGINVFCGSRREWLRIPCADSMQLLYTAGWTQQDLFFAWSRTGCTMSLLPGVDAEVVATAVREHQTDAVAFLSDSLLKNKYYQREWYDFLYRYCRLSDIAPLEQGLTAKQKTIQAHCRELLEELQTEHPRLIRFRREMKAAGLLYDASFTDSPSDKKLQKRQRKLWMQAFVAGYTWHGKEWTDTFASGWNVQEGVAETLLWGRYHDEQLTGAFRYVDEHLVDEAGVVLRISPDDQIRLVHPVELSEKQLKTWRKLFRENKIKQFLPQLSSSCVTILPDEMNGTTCNRWFGCKNTELTVITTAGKWAMRQGQTNRGSYICFHITDDVHEIGAQIRFDRLWCGPEYNTETIVFREAVFYQLPQGDVMVSDEVPEVLRLQPETLPQRFINCVVTAFDSMAGKSK